MNEIINTLKSLTEDQVDGTESPYWMIIDPSGPNIKTKASDIAFCLTGPYFSRADAEEHLKNRHYAFSKKAQVWALSGYWSWKYKKTCNDLKVGYADKNV